MSSPSSPQSTLRSPKVTKNVVEILGWPTDTVSIDYYTPYGAKHLPHTLLLFVPGNPGLIQWYDGMLEALVSALGVGYAARGLSYAGHGLTPDIVDVEAASNDSRDTRIPWTLDGQIEHKIAWMDVIIEELNDLSSKWAPHEHQHQQKRKQPRFTFISHSIGSFMVQRICMLRQTDILSRTQLMIHLMPFTRMDAPQPQRTILKFAKNNPSVMIGSFRNIFRIAKWVPTDWLEMFIRSKVPDERGRQIAMALIRQPTFARNFFELGVQELRDLPTVPDVETLCLLAKYCDITMLYCGGPDHWGPYHHVQDLEKLKVQHAIPKNISTTYKHELRHDFIVNPEMVSPVEFFCLQAIQQVMKHETRLVSRL